MGIEDLVRKKLEKDPLCETCGEPAITVRIVETPDRVTGDPMDTRVALASLCGLHADVEDINV